MCMRINLNIRLKMPKYRIRDVTAFGGGDKVPERLG